jgi:hypothetical protein
VYEPKFDGFRALVFHRPTGAVDVQSRSGKLLTAYFPDVLSTSSYPLEQGPTGSSGSSKARRGCAGAAESELLRRLWRARRCLPLVP